MAKIALTIAGSDSGGGAGIQADLKAFSANGVYGASVITAITAQNTHEVSAVQLVDCDVVFAQIQAVLNDLDIDAIKIGMLASSEIIQTVADALADFTGPMVLDPVMVSKSGDALLQDNAVQTLIEEVLPFADLLTPNIPEAARILGTSPATTPEELHKQGKAICDLGPRAVLMKGGHGKGETCTDYLVTEQEIWEFSAPRINTKNTHGTGCTISSAIAAELAMGAQLPQAIESAHEYLYGAIAAADALNVGQGHGPVHHFYRNWT